MNDNDKSLNSISLGSVDSSNELNVPLKDIPPINDSQNVEVIETLDVNFEPVDAVKSEELTENIDPVPLQPVQSINSENYGYDIPEPINTTPIFNNIGTVPPLGETPQNNNFSSINNQPKNKKNGNKLIFVLIIVLAIAAVGVAVYILLHITNKKPVITKTIELEIGSNLSGNINDYAVFDGVDSSTCSLDTSQVKSTDVYGSEYTYTITCNEDKYTGIIKIVDTISPEVKTKELAVTINSEINAQDFVDLCNDKTKCSYSFKDENLVKENIKKAGTYKVEVVVKDEANNEIVVTSNLVVTDLFLICTNKKSLNNETYKFGINDSMFNKITIRTYSFKFNDVNKYNSFKQENVAMAEITYDGVVGAPSFDDVTNTLVLSKKLTYDDLRKEAGEAIPNWVGELREYYQKKGYSCGLGWG